jgi:nucleotide-binding universal stress UspA family protein
MAKTNAVGTRGRRPILVGVDGSVSAQGALAWAAAAAQSRRCPLRIIHTYTLPLLGSAPDVTVVGDLTVQLRSAAEWILAEAETSARDIAPNIKITRELFIAGAAPTLVSQAQDAEMVVVGSRGIGGFRGLLVGSVSASVAAHATCPVVVVHPHRDGTAFPAFPTGRVVVGVDGSEASAAAIRFAYHEAARRHVGVTAVHAVRRTRPPASSRLPAGIVEQVEQHFFAAAMEPKPVLFPGIDLEMKLVHGHPAQVLIDESDAADLIVVASRGRGGFAGMFLGSVSQAVLQHAACPVAVVHPRPARSVRSLPAIRPRLQIATPNRLPELKELS